VSAGVGDGTDESEGGELRLVEEGASAKDR
jgi:hypothetical protein